MRLLVDQLIMAKMYNVSLFCQLAYTPCRGSIIYEALEKAHLVSLAAAKRAVSMLELLAPAEFFSSFM